MKFFEPGLPRDYAPAPTDPCPLYMNLSIDDILRRAQGEYVFADELDDMRAIEEDAFWEWLRLNDLLQFRRFSGDWCRSNTTKTHSAVHLYRLQPEAPEKLGAMLRNKYSGPRRAPRSGLLKYALEGGSP